LSSDVLTSYLTRRATSLQPEDIPSDSSEISERKIRRPTRRATSLQPEDIPSDSSEISERKIHRPTRRATSLQPEDIPSDEAEICGRKTHKPGSRASSTECEVLPPDETEPSKRKVHKSRSRASCIQHEDFLPDSTETKKGEFHRHSNRSDSVQQEDVSSGVAEIDERKVHTLSVRASSVQDDNVVSGEAVEGERKDRKSSIGAGSASDEMKLHDIMKYENINKATFLQHKDIPADRTESADKKGSKRSSRSGSVECEDDPADKTDEREETVHKSSNRGGSAGQKVVFNETESAEKRAGRCKSRAGSVQKIQLEVIVEEEPCSTEGDKRGNNDYGDIILLDDPVFDENRQVRASSVSSDVSTVVVGVHSSPNSSYSSVQDDGTDVDVRIYSNKSHQPGSNQPNVFPDVVYEKPEENIGLTTVKETEIGNTAVPEIGSITEVSAEKCDTRPSEKVVDDFEGKIKKTCEEAESSASCSAATGTASAVKCSDVEGSDAGTEGSAVIKSIRESKEVIDKSQKNVADGYTAYDAGSVELTLAPVNATRDGDTPRETDDEKEKTQQAVSPFGLSSRDISSPSVLPHETFRFASDAAEHRFRKARSESEYVVGDVTEGRRFTRSMSGFSIGTTSPDVGLITDSNASAKKARRSGISQESTGHSLEALDSTPADGSCSEMPSGSSVKWKRKALSTKKGDSSSMQQVIEEYTTSRRLTRHQRSVLERSLELALQPVAQLR
jgi:hypothetical protein